MRGWACIKTDQIDPVDGPIHDYCSVSSLRRFKLKEAVLLGRRKEGVKEIKTAIKAAAARRNACLPPKPGKFRRGQPRKGFTWGRNVFDLNPANMKSAVGTRICGDWVELVTPFSGAGACGIVEYLL